MKFSGTEIERVLTRYGRMYIPRADSVIGRSLRLYGEWAEHEINCISACINDEGTILDIGGNIGTHTLALAQRHPDCQVVTFEPSAFAFSLLSASAVFNSIQNVTLFNIGCGSEAGVRFLSLDYGEIGWNYGAASFLNRKAEEKDVRPFAFAPLDSFTFDRPILLVKIDVEGMEYDVLKGAKTHLARDQPYVFFEVLELAEAFKCRSLLGELGYTCYWVSTSAYNPHNFNRNPDNVWANGELSILAIADGRAVPGYLSPKHEVTEAQIDMSLDELLSELR